MDRSKTPRRLGYFDCIKAPCLDECPVDQKVPRYMAAVRAGESPRQAAVRHLRALAGRELRDHLLALADRFGLPVKRITIRNQQTRWGSCSPHGAVALNWRLIQMPDSVRDYILIHELMHLRERNHSRRFWTLVEQACPDHRVARRWLKGHEAELL